MWTWSFVWHHSTGCYNCVGDHAHYQHQEKKEDRYNYIIALAGSNNFCACCYNVFS